MLIVEAATVDLSVRTLLYGIYVASLAQCLRWLLFEDMKWKLRRDVNSLTLIVAVIVFVLTTANVSVAFCAAYVSVHSKLSQRSFFKFIFASNTLENVTTFIGDAILISRCWIAYRKSWRMIYFPLSLLLSSLALSIAFTYASVMVIFRSNKNWTVPRTILLYVLSCSHIITNVYSTSTIMFRTVRLKGENADLEPIWYRIARILAESGLLYTLSSVLILMAAIFGKNTIFYPISCAISSLMTGITHNLVLIRVSQHQARLTTNAASIRNVERMKPISNLRFNVPHAASEGYAGEEYSSKSDVQLDVSHATFEGYAQQGYSHKKGVDTNASP